MVVVIVLPHSEVFQTNLQRELAFERLDEWFGIRAVADKLDDGLQAIEK